jgi:hypothetical protein
MASTPIVIVNEGTVNGLHFLFTVNEACFLVGEAGLRLPRTREQNGLYFVFTVKEACLLVGEAGLRLPRTREQNGLYWTAIGRLVS